MTTSNNHRILGFAFLFQFITSFTSGVFLKPLWFIEGDMAGTLQRIASNPGVYRTYLLLDSLTALGVIFLGVCLYLALKNENHHMALTALGFYILEGSILAASKMNGHELLGIAQVLSNTMDRDLLLTMGQLNYEAMEFLGVTIHIIAFSLGAILFYSLLHKSKLVPRLLSLWGLITTLPFPIGFILKFYHIELPFIFYAPYVPFELVIGIWISVKGLKGLTNEPK